MDLPMVGLGTMGIDGPEPIATALDVGFRHFDTAQIYDNVVTIPKASSRAHLEANWEARNVDLEDADVARIDGIDREFELYPE